MARNTVDTEMYKALGAILKANREVRHMSLRELSEKLGGTKSKSTLKRYEDGTAAMTMETLMQICDVLCTDPANVVETAYQMIGAEADYQKYLYGINIAEKEDRLLKAYRDAPDYVKEVVDRLLKIDDT